MEASLEFPIHFLKIYSTLFLGMDVHKDAIAVASVAQDHGAEGTSLGAMGTRQGDIDQRVRQRQSKAPPLIFVYEAGPCGAWLSRSLTNKSYDCLPVTHIYSFRREPVA
jgi:transposase